MAKQRGDAGSRTTRRRLMQATGVGAALSLAGCLDGSEAAARAGSGGTTGGTVGDGELVLATTTSTYDTGLLGELNPTFQESFGITVRTISQGTGAAIRTGRAGDADVILVHAREAEDRFLRDGAGLNRRDVMFNDFVVVGPPEDSAGISGLSSATDAFAAIAEAEATFLSRGDDSGTNETELNVWAAAGVQPSGSWYQETGKGMGDTLVQANRAGGYTLADRGTVLSMAAELDLAIHVQGPLEGGPPILKNPYGVIPVNPAVHDDVNYQAAMAYVGFLTGPQGQSAIANYTVNGSQLFFPNALVTEPNFGQYVPEDLGGRSASTADARFRRWVDEQTGGF